MLFVWAEVVVFLYTKYAKSTRSRKNPGIQYTRTYFKKGVGVGVGVGSRESEPFFEESESESDVRLGVGVGVGVGKKFLRLRRPANEGQKNYGKPFYHYWNLT